MMAVRILCFVLMLLITPYGWYTWVLGAAAVFLPYIAVVIANVGSDVAPPPMENPERMLPAAPSAPSPSPREGAPGVIRIEETRGPELGPGPRADAGPEPEGRA